MSGPRWRCLGILFALVFLRSCRAPSTAGLPTLPPIQYQTFRPQIREQVESAYRDFQARPRDACANGRLATLLHAFQQFESAEICYRRARVLDPGRAQWAYYLGLVETLNGRNEDAAAALRDAARLDAGYFPARLKLAEVLLTLSRLDESEQAARAIANADPRFPPAYYWLGRAAAARGQFAAAAAQYRRACDLWPSYASAHYALAQLSRQAGDVEETRRHMTAYEKYRADGDPQPEDPWLEQVRAFDNTALAHLMKGVDLENADRLDEAVAEHEQAVKLDPGLAQAHANLISLYARLGRAVQAEQAYRATVAINPNLPQSHYDYGVFLVGRQRFRDAEAAFRKALAGSPDYAEAHSNLGAMLERDGRFDEAAREYRAAVADKPNFRLAHFQLGRLLLMRARPREAVVELSQTLAPEDAETPRLYYTLGVAYIQAGDARNGSRCLHEAGWRAAQLGQDRLARDAETALRKLDERTAR